MTRHQNSRRDDDRGSAPLAGFGRRCVVVCKCGCAGVGMWVCVGVCVVGRCMVGGGVSLIDWIPE